MKKKLAMLALGAVLSTGLLATTASAVTVLPGSTSILDTAATSGDGYYDAMTTLARQTGFQSVTKLFHFVAALGFPTVDVDVSASGATSGVTVLTWKDFTAGGPAVTLNNGITNTFTLIVGHVYDLVFQVTHNATTLPSGPVSSSFSVSPTPSPVPVPPAAILLLSGLVGIGALGRKRSGKVSV